MPGVINANKRLQLEARFTRHHLHFKNPGTTSRGVLTEKPTWFLVIMDIESGLKGIGECSPLPGLSIDPLDKYESTLKNICDNIDHYNKFLTGLNEYPSIRFGLETALLDLHNGGKHIIYPSLFTQGIDSITINGLIWMGSPEYMLQQVEEKLAKGFHCLKLKIGAINFEQELAIIRSIREKYNSDEIELRVDANGASLPFDALHKLELLAKLNIHSIEQPIKQGQWKEMASICSNSPIPVALDEELIGINNVEQMSQLLETIKPQYLVLKPGLLGGFAASEKWINMANQMDIKWWATSALESNIGLNAIAQWVYTFNNPLPQGLGTGQLYTNNIDCPLELNGERLKYKSSRNWEAI